MRAFNLLLASLLTACATAAQHSPPIAEPATVQWGAGIEAMQARLAGQCGKMTVRPIKPPFLTAVKDQQQIDCEGFSFFRGKRHAEFVIGDDSLEMLWL